MAWGTESPVKPQSHYDPDVLAELLRQRGYIPGGEDAPHVPSELASREITRQAWRDGYDAALDFIARQIKSIEQRSF